MMHALVENIEKDKAIFQAVFDFWKSHPNRYDKDKFLNNILARKYNIKRFQLSDYIKALIYSQLSNQTRWINIEPHLDEIDSLFFYYDKNAILNTPYTYFYEGIRQLKCGNILIHKQMEALSDNIRMLEQIESDYQDIDIYFATTTAHIIVNEISSGKYKLKFVGKALAWEFLRNAGIDGAKPDIHMKRIFGAGRLGYSSKEIASDHDVILAVSRISKNNDNALLAEIDTLFWNFCASGYGAACTASPECNDCPIRGYCNCNYKFQLASYDDIYEIVGIYHSLIGTPGCTWNLDYPGKETAEDDIANGRLYTLKKNDIIVAVASAGDIDELGDLRWKPKKPCELARIGVRPAYQNQGIGTIMLKNIIGTAGEKGYDGIRMLVSKTNTAALALYDKNGFKRCGEVFRFDIDFYCYQMTF
jgi:GNAT superfamily N-acetyltransferase